MEMSRLLSMSDEEIANMNREELVLLAVGFRGLAEMQAQRAEKYALALVEMTTLIRNITESIPTDRHDELNKPSLKVMAILQK